MPNLPLSPGRVHGFRSLRWLALFLVVIGLSLWGASCSAAAPPNPSQVEATPPAAPETAETIALLTPEITALPTPTAPVQPILSPAIPENRLLVLEWPPKIRVGDADIIRLSLEMDLQGNLTPTAEVGGNQVTTQPVQIPNLYDTHNIIAEARLDLAGMEYAPSGEVNEPLRPGRPVTFLWSVRPNQVGTYQGTIWLHLRFVPLNGGAESRSVLTAQRIEIRGVNLIGLGGSWARVLGSVGTAVGSVLSLDNLVSWLLKLINSRKRQDSKAKSAE